MASGVRVDTATMLVHCPADTTWDDVAAALTPASLAVVGAAAPRAATVGESVSSGELAHRTVAGVSFTTAAGGTVEAGGRTGKDVTGFDLAGLALGSGDRLGTLRTVSLRLEPRGARTPAAPGAGPWRGDAGIDLDAALRS